MAQQNESLGLAQKTDDRQVVLAVDDESDNLELVERALRRDYCVHLAKSGAEALKLLEALPRVDVLIVDQRMPAMRGTELLRIVNESVADPDRIVKILLTAYTEVADIIESINIGRIDYFFSKPFSTEDLRRKVGYLLTRKQHERRRGSRFKTLSAKEVLIGDEPQAEDCIENISQHGLFITTPKHMVVGARVPIIIRLLDGASLDIIAKVVRTDFEHGGVGLEFTNLSSDEEQLLKTLVTHDSGVGSLERIRESFPHVRTSDLVLFDDRKSIQLSLARVIADGVTVTLALPHQQLPTICRIIKHHIWEKELVVTGKNLGLSLKTSEPVLAAYHLDNKTYSFETMVSSIEPAGESARLIAPSVVFYAEKRRRERPSEPCGPAQVIIERPYALDKPLVYTLIEHTQNGLSFYAPGEGLVLPGTILSAIKIQQDGAIIYSGRGEIRHVTLVPDDPDRVRVGVEFGLGRKSTLSLQKEAAPTATSGAPENPVSAPAENPQTTFALLKNPFEVVRFESSPGEEIVGLLNETGPKDAPAHVVIVPPAYGKKKENLVGLALTLAETFRAANKHVVVLRYDGARRRGESFHDSGCESSHNQMVRATLGQGAQDMRAAINYAEHNPRFKAESITLVTFSLSSVEARLLFRDKAMRNLVSYLVVCMGVPELSEILVRASGGIDRVENFRLGIKMGIVPMFGARVDADHFLKDAFVNDLVDYQRAKQDFAELDVPVTWIYGAFDRWVDAEQVNDIMAVSAQARREVLEVNLGHQARSSEEAIEMFGRISELVLRRVAAQNMPAVLPPAETFMFVMQAERERLPNPAPPSLKDYWRTYLLGEGRSLGFDVMWFSDDYQDLLQTQFEFLDAKEGQKVIELGAGTGNFSTYLLSHFNNSLSDLVVTDLVPEALKRASEKLAPFKNKVTNPKGIELKTLDLEINRYAVLKEFLAGEFYSITALPGRLEGLGVQVAQTIADCYSPKLHAYIRGSKTSCLDLDDEIWLKQTFDLDAQRVCRDLRTASMVLRGQKAPEAARYEVLKFPSDIENNFQLPFADGQFDRVIMSLVLSYVREPERTLREIYRILAPGGVLVASTMAPDADFSGAFRAVIGKIEAAPESALPSGWDKAYALDSARQLLNDASNLSDLETDGVFEFFAAKQFETLLASAGFSEIQIAPAFGKPPQAIVARAKR